MPPFEKCIGNTMVDRHFLPHGFCLAFLRDEGMITVHAYFGDWLKIYPKDILRGMKPVIDRIRDAGFYTVYASAEVGVDGADTLIRWFKGVPINQKTPNGADWYVVDLTRTPI